MIHPDVKKSMLIALDEYANLFITATLCTYKKGSGRLYTVAILEIGRKNHKTFTSAVIFIILMLIEPRFARLFSVAPDYKLSSELRLAVRKIIKSSPLLDPRFKITRDMITCRLTDIEYTPLAYSNDNLDGKLANAFLADEDGNMDAYPVEAMSSSQVELTEKLGIIISTQYPNENNDFIERIDFAKKSLDGIIVHNNVFALLYEPDDELINLWETDDRVLYQSNPIAAYKPQVLENLIKKREEAILYESRRENFLCKHCNIRYKSVGSEGYIPIDKVQMCRQDIPKEWWKGRKVYLGGDLAQTDDNAAIAMVTLDNDIIYSKVCGFIPAEKIELKSTKEEFNYSAAVNAGYCIACGDEVIDYLTIENYILSLEKEYGVEVMGLGIDPYNALSTVQKLESAENPVECVLIKQHSSVLHPATKLLKEKILQKKFVYDRNSLLENSFENARCTKDTNLNMYVNKKRSAGKVDMVVSLINATYMIIDNEILGNDFVYQII
ncbi:MAG: terminase TerL endonuclease subunit [Huintestinicola sp.]